MLAVPFIPHNIVALDQERKAIVAVVNGGMPVIFDPVRDVANLPTGGGYVVADANVWAVRNDLSKSQYCWETEADRDAFVNALESAGYRAIVVANMLAKTLYMRQGLPQSDAVRALYTYVHDQVSSPKGRSAAPLTTSLGCGTCTYHWTFDSGHPVRPPAAGSVDQSFGQRRIVARDFLRLQNDGGYESDFAQDALAVAWAAWTPEQREAMGLKKTRPTGQANRVAAIAVCTHDPDTGQLRTHEGAPWGRNFIMRHLIGLNGVMRGTGPLAPGNPMRAQLRLCGRRHGAKTNRESRALMDQAVRVAIHALQQHPVLPRPLCEAPIQATTGGECLSLFTADDLED